MNTSNVDNLINQLKQLQSDFHATFGVTDIITNSKIFEILIANSLDHILIPGHSGSRDAKDATGKEFEYKHYKESSSNHSWTFNDFSDTTITKLANTKAVIFAHIQDADLPFPKFDWYYEVSGRVISDYLAKATRKIKNNRKMINVSPKQIEERMGLTKQIVSHSSGRYSSWIKRIIDVAGKIEIEVGTVGILTSNKFWEVLVALKLGHRVQSEQAKHDATDKAGNMYEYKVAKGSSWSFQDISNDVLRKYLSDQNIILACVDKDDFLVKKIYVANTKKIVGLLRKKLREKKRRYSLLGKEVRRKQISLTVKDLRNIRTKLIYSAD
ncbi:MAG: hypothetical protein A3G49_04410 [Candidatus Sungbacteria bacterium RIFCSPLOWO2_12_FULL_41_11]|uniref:Restriction endonuclease n=1 Tax=Candidatus Sungbacteria bacterium RIFCSPLOWO2_12_FULL_41_11 TaxID=1802286 RepID=A0A1G2LMS0_9BACT|nr:MAG: hypothetical protein UV01_C0001G0033 [Parcubacteria group bacterium GW2011_GWA2_42_14]OGZ97523.1 MAG: hypothetical protein A3D41_01400 [Candidatus Sungbacteria bacterium RIFCSPHIGHO2_02_FULL_41_12b]OHA12918.1 MAG: hypothetical protein A3G49_04410 [Candidatus Sungbacteria bacterium RIFCSPLOWO2_12_FULL_41_11]